MELFGRYQLMDRIACGGMAEVFDAKMLGAAEGRYALKRLLPHLASKQDFLQRFQREAHHAQGARHERLPRVVETGHVGGVPYLVMERLDGADLARVRNRGPLPAALAVAIVDAVAEALHYLHSRPGEPLAHGDVTPSNVLLGADGSITLIDLGLSQPVETPFPEGWDAAGSPAYQSPERVDGQPASPGSDQFALGALFWELLVGRPLFKKRSLVATLLAVLTEAPLPPSRLVPGLPASFDPVVLRSLAREPQARYPDLASFRRALREADEDRGSGESGESGGSADLARFMRSFLAKPKDSAVCHRKLEKTRASSS